MKACLLFLTANKLFSCVATRLLLRTVVHPVMGFDVFYNDFRITQMAQHIPGKRWIFPAHQQVIPLPVALADSFVHVYVPQEWKANVGKNFMSINFPCILMIHIGYIVCSTGAAFSVFDHRAFHEHHPGSHPIPPQIHRIIFDQAVTGWHGAVFLHAFAGAGGSTAKQEIITAQFFPDFFRVSLAQ